MEELSDRVKKRRLELGLTQEELAKRMGYSSRVSINKIEMGRPISQKIISRLSVALNVSEAYLMGWTGLRFNEANSLTFDCVKNSVINVWRQYDKGWKVLKTKGSKRKVPIDKATNNVIQEMKEYWSSYPDFSESWFIFGGPRQLPETTINRYKAKAAKKAHLKNIRSHDFRHSHASYLIEKKVNIYKISKRLGHSKISITLDTYGHLLDVDGDEILRAIETDI